MSTAQLLARFHELVDELHALDLTTLTSTELLEFLRGLETQKRRLPTVDHALVAELDRRGIAGELLARNTTTLLRDVLRLAPREAKARYTAAVGLGPRTTLTGEPLGPLLRVTAAAQVAGAISPDHARVIRRAIEALPAAVETEHGPAVEAALVEHAQHYDPDQLAQLARRIRDLLDPDGTLTDTDDHARRRHATLSRHRDGTGELSARLTPTSLAKLQAVLDPLAKPRPADDSGPDDRTPGQRLHDALEDSADRLPASDTLPHGGGTPATVLLTITAEHATTRTGQARTGHAGLLPIRDALKLADQAELLPVLLGAHGEVLACWRHKRIATETQRRALAARDLGCSFPGCPEPPSRCQAHHVRDWLDGGHTNTDNLTLLCAYHHRNFEQRGWTVRTRHGVPEWIPPPRIDPEQKPRRNHTHDPLRQ